MKGRVVNNDTNHWDNGDWADWPEPDLGVDDEAFAAAIAHGRELEEAA